jgi:hypothetical protein
MRAVCTVRRKHILQNISQQWLMLDPQTLDSVDPEDEGRKPLQKSVSSFQPTWHHSPDALNLQPHHCENLKSHDGSCCGVHTLHLNLPHF